MIQVTFPVPQQYIKVELEKVSNEIRAKWAELKSLQAMKKAIQEQCAHPDVVAGECQACGESWY